MLRKLRLQLTLLYLVASVALALLVGGGAYSLVNYYFQTTNDQALKVKMGLALMDLNIPLPADLALAVQKAGFNASNIPTPQSTIVSGATSSEDNPNEDLGEGHGLERESVLADIYILPLTLNGDLVTGFNSQSNTTVVNLEAVTAARKTGSDFRTFLNQNGIKVRLFTYVISGKEQVQVFQAGRFLSSQEGVLQDLMRTMILAGGIVTLLFGVASWLLAGRTIKPSQEAWDKQQTFIANASHELRTPLTLMRAGVELGLRKAHNQEQRDLLTDVLSDADYMKKLIEDLLLMSRLDAHSLKLDLQSVPLLEFIPELTRQLSLLAENQNVTIQESLTEVSALADPVRLKQVLLIIMDNALRNSPSGGVVQIETYLQKTDVIIKVTDQGQGIRKEDLKKVFDRFYKADDRSTQEYRGTGLGLSIAKGLIEAQNGHIHLVSSQGNGTAVTLTIPAILKKS